MHLIEISGAGVVVHVRLDLVDAGERMQHRHGGRRHLQQLFVQLIAAFQPQVVLFVEKALFLDSGHVQHVQTGQFGFKVSGLLVVLVQRGQGLILDVLRDAQLLG